MLQGGEEFFHPSVDLLVGLCEEALPLAADQIGQREIVLPAVIRREDHLVVRRIQFVLLYFCVPHLQPELAEPLYEDVILVLQGF